MWSKVGALSPLGGASRRVRMSSWIILGLQEGLVTVPHNIRPRAAVAHGPPGLSSAIGRPILGSAVKRRRLAPVLVLAALATPVAAGAQQTPLQARLAKALRVPHVAPASSAAVAMDLATGSILFTQNQALPLAPASNEKLPLTYAALSNLGASFRIETDVLGEGSQTGTTFDGSIVLKGGGDPTLSTAALRLLAAQVRAAGIRHVTRGIVGDEAYFDRRRTGPGWKRSFYIQEAAPPAAL